MLPRMETQIQVMKRNIVKKIMGRIICRAFVNITDYCSDRICSDEFALFTTNRKA